MLARLSAVIAALLSLAAAPAPTLERFALERADGWAEALALCDITRFLIAQPELDAEVIMVRDDRTGWLTPLYGPRFTPPTLYADGRVTDAYYRLERRGEIDRRSAVEARFRLARLMLDVFRRQSGEEERFLREQDRTCSALTAQTRTE